MTPVIRRRIPLGTMMIGEKEIVCVRFDWTPWGTPETPTVVIEDELTGADLSGVMLTGIPSVQGNIIFAPNLHDTVESVKYRLSCRVHIVGDVVGTFYEAYVIILGDR